MFAFRKEGATGPLKPLPQRSQHKVVGEADIVQLASAGVEGRESKTEPVVTAPAPKLEAAALVTAPTNDLAAFSSSVELPKERTAHRDKVVYDAVDDDLFL